MWFFPIGHPPRSPETMIRFSQTILDKQNSSQGIAGWTPESSTRTFFFFSECGAKEQKRGEHLGYEGIYDPGEGEEQESLQLVPWTPAAVSVRVPISRLMFIA